MLGPVNHFCVQRTIFKIFMQHILFDLKNMMQPGFFKNVYQHARILGNFYNELFFANVLWTFYILKSTRFLYILFRCISIKVSHEKNRLIQSLLSEAVILFFLCDLVKFKTGFNFCLRHLIFSYLL